MVLSTSIDRSHVRVELFFRRADTKRRGATRSSARKAAHISVEKMRGLQERQRRDEYEIEFSSMHNEHTCRKITP